MRPLRLLLSLSSCLIAVTLLLYAGFGSQHRESAVHTASHVKKSKYKALFSFTSPASLFPPSAIISLTDDNSTFFLARPAAFGPLLPSKGLSGPLWIGSGFGDDTTIGHGGMAGGADGELGCSDVPGWSDGGNDLAGSPDIALDPKRKSLGTSGPDGDKSDMKPSSRLRRGQSGAVSRTKDNAEDDDGTDDYLHRPLPNSEISKIHAPIGTNKDSGHADIQSLQEGAEIAGKVVLLKRGGCGFLEKVKWAQRRGGVALIVGDDVRGGALVRMYAHGDTSNITIPALFTSHTTAHLLSSLIPSGGLLQDLSPEEAAKLGIKQPGKGDKNAKNKDSSAKKPDEGDRPTFTQSSLIPSPTSKTSNAGKQNIAKPSSEHPMSSDDAGWFRSFLFALGLGNPGRQPSKGDSSRPPSSGNIDWVLVEDWDDDKPSKKPTKSSKKPKAQKPTATTKASDDFVIGEQDWRDPDLLPQQTSTNYRVSSPGKPKQEAGKDQLKGGSNVPGSGEYHKDDIAATNSKHESNEDEGKGWFRSLLGDDNDDDDYKPAPSKRKNSKQVSKPTQSVSASSRIKGNGDFPGGFSEHDGLWVTLTPTSVSSSPFFDTLLVLVVSPLVTLTVVYALLLLRSRLRRRRWRAPKSVVERLPVRTYHTISSDTNSSASPAPTPDASSPTTPLLHHSHSRTTPSRSRPRSRTTSEVPATSSSFQQTRDRSSSREEEKREAGLAEWRRRYGGRQKECVVCLEEYVDGVSRVMSLPCGHEFHAECITPWLVTRRRTCPICKGDVVRSLTQAHHERALHALTSRQQPYRDEPESDVQAQAAESRNESPSAARPIPPSRTLSETMYEDLEADVEANWTDDGDGADEREGRGEESREGAFVLSSSMRELGVSIWRRLEAATGLQRRASQERIDRDR